MSKHPFAMGALLALSLSIVAPGAAQSPSTAPAVPTVSSLSPDVMVAARELVTTMKMSDQLKTLVPMLAKNMKASMLVGRSPEFVRDFEAIMPAVMAAFEQRYDELTDVLAGVYAANFTVDELHDMTTFYRSSTGQKVLQLLPVVAQQSMQVGQAYGHRIGEELKQRLVDEMRKKGYDI
jgi:uncharacterized protein